MNKIKIRNGRSAEDSVTYYLEGSIKGYQAIRNKDGTISKKVIEIIPSVSIRDDLKSLKIFGIILLLYLIRKSVFIFNLPIWVYHIPTVYWIGYFVKIIAELMKEPECRKYHGAEHKVGNWFKKNIQENDIKSIQKCSRIHLSCGTNLYGTIILFQIISSLTFTLFNYHITEFVTSILPLFLYTTLPFNSLGLLLQFITTAKPSDEHIEVAYTALSEALKHMDQEVSNFIAD